MEAELRHVMAEAGQEQPSQSRDALFRPQSEEPDLGRVLEQACRLVQAFRTQFLEGAREIRYLEIEMRADRLANRPCPFAPTE